jgi:hypothetical protein
MTHFQLCRSASKSKQLTEFLMHGSETIKLHWMLMAFYGEVTVGIGTILVEVWI